MFSILLTFILYFHFSRYFCSDNTRIIDLSYMNISLSQNEDHSFNISLFKPDNWEYIKIKNNVKMNCKMDDLVNLEIEMKEKECIISIPFNISCGRVRNIYSVAEIKSFISVSEITVLWKVPSKTILYYLILNIDSNGNYKLYIVNQTSYVLTQLKKESSYRICVAAIDEGWQTSSFKCTKTLEILDCFTDCYTSKVYSGIRSADKDGNKCTEWEKFINYSKYFESRSNICNVINGMIPSCPVSNSLKPCDITRCSELDSDIGCVSMGIINIFTHSIAIKWSPPQYVNDFMGYMILVHNKNQFCQKYNIQFKGPYSSESQLHIRVKNFYLSCSTGSVDQSIKFETQFDNLHQNKQYFVYIIPIVNESFVGEVKNISVKTHLSKPITPQNVDCRSRSVDYIELSWDKQIETDKHGQSDYYIVSMRKFERRENKESRTEKEYKKLRNLEMCSQYCVSVRSVNSAGSSKLSKEICCRTLAPKPGDVTLFDPISEYSTNRMIEWKIENSKKNCGRIFRLDYFVKYLGGTSLTAQTNESSFELRNLTKNRIYVVKVRAENTMETDENETVGEYSPTKEFFTGLTTLKDLQNKIVCPINENYLNISWSIYEEMEELMFEYIINLKTSEGKCIRSVRLECANCEGQMNRSFLTETSKSLNCSRNDNGSFYKDQRVFQHAIKDSTFPTDIFVEIFGVNLLGVHQLCSNQRNSSVTSWIRMLPSSTTLAVGIAIGLFLVCFITIAIKKRNSSSSSFSTSFVKETKGPAGTNTNSDNFEYNVPCPETNGIQSEIKESHVDIDARPESNKGLPEIKAKQKIRNNLTRKTIRLREPNNAIMISNFPRYMEQIRKNGNIELINDYKKLSVKSKSLQNSLSLTVHVGKSSVNAKKNRFVDILPFDQNRVQIRESLSNNDYINASYISFVNDKSKYEYIAAQGPIEGTLSDFWQMILEQNINCIVMLTQTVEDKKFKCLQYWPDLVNEKQSFGYNDKLTITMIKEEENESHIERELLVENMETNEQRKINHFHMHLWFDHSAPSLDHFDKLLFRFQEVAHVNSNHPYLIHCSAGVGRTGTLICIDRIIKELVNGNQKINIYETVFNLRQYRNLMVQKQAQYIFIHEYIEYFLSQYMQLEDTEESIYFNEK